MANIKKILLALLRFLFIFVFLSSSKINAITYEFNEVRKLDNSMKKASTEHKRKDILSKTRPSVVEAYVFKNIDSLNKISTVLSASSTLETIEEYKNFNKDIKDISVCTLQDLENDSSKKLLK